MVVLWLSWNVGSDYLLRKCLWEWREKRNHPSAPFFHSVREAQSNTDTRGQISNHSLHALLQARSISAHCGVPFPYLCHCAQGMPRRRVGPLPSVRRAIKASLTLNQRSCTANRLFRRGTPATEIAVRFRIHWAPQHTWNLACVSQGVVCTILRLTQVLPALRCTL